MHCSGLVTGASFVDQDRLNELLRNHTPALRAVCTRYASRDDEVDDILQDTLLEIVRNIHSFRGESSFMTWAARVAFTQANRHRRRRRRFSTRDGAIAAVATSIPDYFSADFNDPERAAFGAEDSRRVAVAVARLAELDRDVLLLRDLHGYSTSEVAEQLGLSAAAVKSRLHRARAQFRQSLLRGARPVVAFSSEESSTPEAVR